MGAGGRVASTSNASTRPARVWVAEGPRGAEEIQRLEEERRLTLKMRDFRTMDDLHDDVDGFSDHYSNNGSNSYFSRYRDSSNSGSDLVLLNGGSCYELLSEFDRLGGYGYELDETQTRVVNCGAPQLTRTVQVAEAKNRSMARKAGRDGIHAIVLQRNTWFLLHSVAAKVSEEDERRNREIAAFIRALGEQQQQQQNVNLQQQKVANSSDGDDLLAAIPRTMASVDACDEDFDDENDVVVDPQNIVAQQPQLIVAPVLPTGSAASNMDVDVQQKQQQNEQQQEQQATIVVSGAIGSRPEQTWPAPSASISNSISNNGSHRSASLPVMLLPIGTAGISDKQNSNNSNNTYVARRPIRRSRSTGTIFSCGGSSSISFGDSSSSDNSLAKKARCTPECIMA